MKAVLTLAAAYALAFTFALSLARAAARGDRLHDQAQTADPQSETWWAELDRMDGRR